MPACILARTPHRSITHRLIPIEDVCFIATALLLEITYREHVLVVHSINVLAELGEIPPIAYVLASVLRQHLLLSLDTIRPSYALLYAHLPPSHTHPLESALTSVQLRYMILLGYSATLEQVLLPLANASTNVLLDLFTGMSQLANA